MSERGIRQGGETAYSIPPGTKLRPLRDQIIVKPLPLKYSKIIDCEYTGKPTRGEVVAVGPGKYANIHERGTRDGKPYHTIRQSKYFTPPELKPGDIVELGGLQIGGYLFEQVGIDGVPHVICQEADVAVVHER